MSSLSLANSLLGTVLFAACMGISAPAAEWQPAEGPLKTRWATEVSPDNALPEYPRPQMVREDWRNLNGLWQYAIRPKDESQPEEWDGEILVPFCPESALSGVMKQVGPENRLWYRRQFDLPSIPEGGRMLLHFGAVDWRTAVWVNGKKAGEHQGGYDPFTLDITDALISYLPGDNVDSKGGQEIVVSVWDPADAGYQPRGKQVREPRGIWYTSVTGIWQTVWLEPVPKIYVQALKITPDCSSDEVHLDLQLSGREERTRNRITVSAADGKQVASLDSSENGGTLKIPDARRWSPEDPYLYSLEIQTASGDKISSYFAMRQIEVKADDDGFNRLVLNGDPLFQFGPLDQGWWPDGLYTAPTDAALKHDIEVTKKLGFNMCRKHVKVEPDRWYYWCDKLGLLVWQDMPNGDRHIRPEDADIERTAESEENYRREWQAIMDARRNHPCIVAWVPFNEGWGQFKTNEILAWTKEYDPTRLVDGPSGWSDRGAGDMNDMHRYPGPAMPDPEEDRAVVLGEFGGLGWPVKDHLWWDKRNWGYRTYESQAELQQNYEQLIRRLRPLIGKGLAAAIYTQTTDVEGEVNGLMTYDRALVKLDAERIAPLHEKLYGPPPIVTSKVLAATSEKEPQTWRFVTIEPGKGWEKADFDDAKWSTGPGGFGEESTPGSFVRTDWKTNDIWLRRTFDLAAGDLHDVLLRIHHDEDAEVYINGVLAVKLSGFVTDYADVVISDAARAALKEGRNTLAVHCRQTGGGQYIDAGLMDVEEKEKANENDK